MEQSNLRGRFILIAVVTGLLVWALLGWGIRLGQDLKGGTTLRFSLDLDRAEQEGRIKKGAVREKVVKDTIAVIRDRIDRFGLSETVITQLGDDKFEISLPAGSEGEVDSIRGVVTSLGDLKFRIEVLPQDQYGTARDGKEPLRLKSQETWPWKGSAEEFRSFKEKEVQLWRTADETNTAYEPSRTGYRVYKKFGTDGSKDADFVVLEEPLEDVYRFDGGVLTDPTTGRNPRDGRPVVLYEVKLAYQGVFAEWTGRNVGLPMSIVLNDRYRTAPTIQETLRDSVQISLGEGSYKQLEEEARNLTTVLQTGSLKVRPTLISVNKVGARLAGASRDRGIIAVIVALVLVLIFMLIYYHMQGAVANIALLLNLVLLVGTLAFFQAVLTLPGIAGIVLTLGMAVDANILINERIREERNQGRSLRRAVSEGYDRALTTIVDANVTSLITALFLYQFGSGPVKGFAITLAIGLILSMFTSIFVTRTINEWLMKIGWFKEIHMVGTGIPPKISWVALRRYFAPISAAGVVFGVLVFGAEDRYTLYDVDFTGGIKLQARFQKATTVDDVKQALNRAGVKDVQVEVERFTKDSAQRKVKETLNVRAGPYPTADVVAVGDDTWGVEVTVQEGLDPKDLPDDEVLKVEVPPKAFQAYVRDALGDRLRPAWLGDGLIRTFDAATSGDAELADLDGGKAFAITLVDPPDLVTSERLKKSFVEHLPFWVWRGSDRERRNASEVKRDVVVRPVTGAHDEGSSLKSFQVWMKSTNPTSGDVVEADPKRLGESLAEFLGGKGFRNALEAQLKDEGAEVPKDLEEVGLSEPFPSVDVIGTTVAEGLKNDAMVALVLSLLGIIVYIALRFSSRAMGFAAVICLFHDVAITLGVVAVANMLGIVDAKINLPMVAAFLTLVGYSVNDTVVVFDRIRENRGKKRVITAAMIDLSINQTLARTIKTSITFLLATVALFAINIGQRNVLEGFAFLLIVGSVIGTYSTVAIASPLLLFLPWLWERVQGIRPRKEVVTVPMSNWVTLILTPVGAVVWLAWAVLFVVFTFVLGLVLFPVWALSERIDVEVAPA